MADDHLHLAFLALLASVRRRCRQIDLQSDLFKSLYQKCTFKDHQSLGRLSPEADKVRASTEMVQDCRTDANCLACACKGQPHTAASLLGAAVGSCSAVRGRGNLKGWS